MMFLCGINYDYYYHHHMVVSWCKNNTIPKITIPLTFRHITTTGYSMLHKTKIETTILIQQEG